MDSERERYEAMHDALKKFGAKIISEATAKVEEDKKIIGQRLEFWTAKGLVNTPMFERDSELIEMRPRALRVFTELYQKALDELLKDQNPNKIIDLYNTALHIAYDPTHGEHNSFNEVWYTFHMIGRDNLPEFGKILQSFNLLPVEMLERHTALYQNNEDELEREEGDLEEDRALLVAEGLLEDEKDKKN